MVHELLGTNLIHNIEQQENKQKRVIMINNFENFGFCFFSAFFLKITPS